MIVCTEEVDNRDILGFRGSLVQKALLFNIIVSDPSPWSHGQSRTLNC